MSIVLFCVLLKMYQTASDYLDILPHDPTKWKKCTHNSNSLFLRMQVVIFLNNWWLDIEVYSIGEDEK